MPAKPRPPRPPATCHPDKPTHSKGLCQRCYMRQYMRVARATEAVVTDAARPLRKVLEMAGEGPPRDLAQALDIAQAVQIAQEELILALPEAVKALRRILAEGKPDAGISFKAAVAVLRGVSVPGGKAGLKRLLEAPAKPAEGAGPAQVVIGLHVSSGDVQVGRVVGTIGKGDP